MKIISRTQAISIARLVSQEKAKCINANDLMYEYVSVCDNGDIDVGISYIGDDDLYNFTIDYNSIYLSSITKFDANNE